MFRKIKRYVVDDIESAEKDVAVTTASLLYDVARDDGVDVLHYGEGCCQTNENSHQIAGAA